MLVVISLALCLGSTTFGKTRLILDFFANPNHVPIYVAQELGFFTTNGGEVEILIPADPSDPVKLVAAGTVEVALTPQINFLIAKGAGLPLTAIGALIETPLGGLLSLKEYGIGDLSDLCGRRIGYSLTPLEPTLWRTMLATVDVGIEEFELVNGRFRTGVDRLYFSRELERKLQFQVPGKVAERWITVKARGRTVREILNRLVQAHGDATWLRLKKKVYIGLPRRSPI